MIRLLSDILDALELLREKEVSRPGSFPNHTYLEQIAFHDDDDDDDFHNYFIISAVHLSRKHCRVVSVE